MTATKAEKMMTSETDTNTIRYRTDFGGPMAIRWNRCTGPLRVFRASEDEAIIGVALPCGPSPCGLVLYRLEIEGRPQAGRYFCVNRVFVRDDSR